MGCDACSRRFIGRIGSRGGRRTDAGGHGYRHRRFDPPTGGTERRVRTETDVRCRLALRHGRVRVESRPRRTARAFRRRPRTRVRRHRRIRREGFDERHPQRANCGRAHCQPRQTTDARLAARVPGDADRRGIRAGIRRGPARTRVVGTHLRRSIAAAYRRRGAYLLCHRVGRSVDESGALRWRALRPPLHGTRSI